MKKIWIIGVVLLSACSKSTLEDELGFSNKTVPQIIEMINESEEIKSQVSASITGTELTITSKEEILTYDVGEEFYLAVAPYVNFTHT